MKTFILVGGDINSANDQGVSYYKELIGNFYNQNIRVLVIAFAREEKEWSQIRVESEQQLQRYAQKVDVTIASPDKNTFRQQVAQSDLIIIKGGLTSRLIEMLKFLGFADMNLDDKRISGSSAGAYVLSKQYYSLVDQKIETGLGLVNTNIIVHYLSPSYPHVNWDVATSAFRTEDPITLLPEGMYKVFTN